MDTDRHVRGQSDNSSKNRGHAQHPNAILRHMDTTTLYRVNSISISPDNVGAFTNLSLGLTKCDGLANHQGMVLAHELRILVPKDRAAEFPIGSVVVMYVRAATDEETKHAVATEAKAAEEEIAWRAKVGTICVGA